MINNLLQKAISLHKQQRFIEAEEKYNEILEIDNQNIDAVHFLGLIKFEKKDFEKAIIFFKKAISLNKKIPAFYNNLGLVFKEIKKYDDANICFENALSLDDKNIIAINNLGVICAFTNNHEKAIYYFDKVIDLDPTFYDAFNNKALSLYEIKKYQEAVDNFSKVINVKPEQAQTYVSRAKSLAKINKISAAKLDFDIAISIDSNNANYFSERGNFHVDNKNDLQAIEDFKRSLSLGSNLSLGELLLSESRLHLWENMENRIKDIHYKIKNNLCFIDPLILLTFFDDPKLSIINLNKFYSTQLTSLTLLNPLNKRNNKKIRIGYFSADFRNHPVAYLISEVLEIHNKDFFEIYGFTLKKSATDEYSSRIANIFKDNFYDLENKTDYDSAIFVRSLELDIAVDLGGHTLNSPLGIFQYKIAPIQINFLGYPGTTGANFMDYIVADKIIINEENKNYFTEKIIYMPNSYQANDRKLDYFLKEFTKKDLQLPENNFIFCCFNSNTRILPETFKVWMEILKKVDQSVLWLIENNETAKINLKLTAKKEGINFDRIIFSKPLPFNQHLARIKLSDLFLDTWPYNAHTTASDVLWSGIPIVTFQGNSFQSRVAASLLHAIDIPELITYSIEDYKNLAIELALDSKKLAEIKKKLELNRFKTSLFDTPSYTKNLEQVYKKVNDLYKLNKNPEDIYI